MKHKYTTYSKWYLNLALWLRSKARCLTFGKSQGGPVVSFLETLLDIRHQETFSNTIPNINARCEELRGYNVPV